MTNKRFYKLITPDKEYLIRVYGAHHVAVSISGLEYVYREQRDKPILMTLSYALYLAKRVDNIPYYKHVTKVCKVVLL